MSLRRFAHLALVVAVVFFVACGSDEDTGLKTFALPPVDGGGADGFAADAHDAGPRNQDTGSQSDTAWAEDSGATIDAGSPLDSGKSGDSGTSGDTGAAADSGAVADAGSSTDSGAVADAGSSADSGAVADAGSSADSGASADTGSAADMGSGTATDASSATDAGSWPSADAGAPSTAPARYPSGVVHSPIPYAVAEAMRDIADKGPKLYDDVFMKVGASSTVSTKTLHCFAGSKVDLGAYKSLKPTLDYFLAGKAGSTTPFDRKTKAAKSGKTAKWVTTGSPSPLSTEIKALSPGLAIVHYGTNDMGMGATYMHASYPFYTSMMKLLTTLTSQGIVPILTGVSPRKDSSKANRWVGVYNALIRGLAQRFQVPFIDLWLATAKLKGHGMSSDGLHLNGYWKGACLLSATGLGYGYNVRNLIVLQALDRMRKVLVVGTQQLDADGPHDVGDGGPNSPIVIAKLPFSDSRDTALHGTKNIAKYTGCKSTADESGPEVLYRLKVAKTTALRALVVDGTGVDIDVHLLDSTATAAGCIARNHRIVAGTLKAGTYHLSLDSFTSKGKAASGEYLLVVVPCDTGDPECTKKLN